MGLAPRIAEEFLRTRITPNPAVKSVHCPVCLKSRLIGEEKQIQIIGKYFLEQDGGFKPKSFIFIAEPLYQDKTVRIKL